MHSILATLAFQYLVSYGLEKMKSISLADIVRIADEPGTGAPKNPSVLD